LLASRYGLFSGKGLVFVAFGKSFDAFEALLNRMVGKEDGITDALFTFTRPLTGNYFWCPPSKDGRLATSPPSESETSTIGSDPNVDVRVTFLHTRLRRIGYGEASVNGSV
jgi:hypothetical protein